MSRFHYIILILAYICGLLLTGFWGVPNPHPSWQQWGIICLIIIVVPPSLFFGYNIVGGVVQSYNFGGWFLLLL